MPRPHESKQDFLRRKVRELMARGESEEQALALASRAWNQAHLETGETGCAHLSAAVHLAGEAPGDGPRRFSILAYTGKRVRTWFGEFVIDLAGLALSRDKVPCLYHHNAQERDEIVGVIDKADTTGAGFGVFGAFSAVTPASRQVQDLADEGFPFQASLGVRMLRQEELGPGEEARINGRSEVGPLSIWRQAEVFETSILPFGADNETAAIAMSADGTGNRNPQEDEMNKRLKALLVRLGLSADASDEQAKAFLAGLDLDTVQLKEPDKPLDDEETALLKDSQGQLAGTGGQDPGAPGPQALLSAGDVDLLHANGEGLGLSRGEVSQAIAQAGPQADFKAVNQALFQQAASRPAHQPFGAGTRLGQLEQGPSHADKFRAAAVDAQLMRCGMALERPAPGAEELRGLSLAGLARESLHQAGIKGVLRMGRDQLWRELGRATLAQHSSDFPSIFRDVTHKRLLGAYLAAPATWRAWVNVSSATDFRPMHGVQLSAAPKLELVRENGEYKEGVFSDSGESYRLLSHGKVVYLSREMFINDDLRAFSRMPVLFGAAARRLEADMVYDLLCGGPVMNDGKALFHSDHGNLASAAAAPDKDSLKAARAAMRKQRDISGQEILDLTPRFIIVPVDYETETEIILRSSTLPEDNKPAGTHNPFAAKLTPVSDPRLDAKSGLAWYLACDPTQGDTIEAAYLDGVEQPRVRDQDVFGRNGIGYEITHDFGCGVMDFRGLYKVPAE